MKEIPVLKIYQIIMGIEKKLETPIYFQYQTNRKKETLKKLLIKEKKLYFK